MEINKVLEFFDYDILILVVNLTECSEAQKIFNDFLTIIDLSALEEDDLTVLHYKIYEEKLTQPVLKVKVNVEKCTVDIKRKVKMHLSDAFELKKFA